MVALQHRDGQKNQKGSIPIWFLWGFSLLGAKGRSYNQRMAQLKAYRTVAPDGVGQSLFEDRKSQFHGFAVHAESAEEAIAFRHSVMERIPSASHYVSAWVLADGGEFYSDAKEPHGSAGLPVLNVIKGAGVADTACVVARIFGGTLLGKGGLMRAYTKAATDALAAASIVSRVPCQLLDVVVPYPLYEPLSKRAGDWQATVDGSDFAENVTMHLSVPVDCAQGLVDGIREFSDARAVCTLGGQELRFLAQDVAGATDAGSGDVDA